MNSPSVPHPSCTAEGSSLLRRWRRECSRREPGHAFGVLPGVVFGVGGDWSRRDGARQILGTALPAAVFFEEAARFAGRAGDPGHRLGAGWNVAIDVTLGVLAVVLVGRSNRQRALALPGAVVIFLGFAVAAG
ncbi:DUF6518 family protein [Micromonospora sp. NPDC005299]|uniref:DUF6518 family protein n=1 Tax=Micromonospora sp. NPDC005299 TaxID=3364231 RepID=UPI00368C0DC9